MSEGTLCNNLWCSYGKPCARKHQEVKKRNIGYLATGQLFMHRYKTNSTGHYTDHEYRAIYLL